MPSAEFAPALDRLLNYYEGSKPYSASTNPGGFQFGGHRVNFDPALEDVAKVALGIGQLTEDLQELIQDALAAYGSAAALTAAIVQAQASAKKAQDTVAAGRVAKDRLNGIGGLATDLGFPDGAVGEVLSGPADEIGYYTKSGPPGSGAWVKKSSATVPGLDASQRRRTRGISSASLPGGALRQTLDGRGAITERANSDGSTSFAFARLDQMSFGGEVRRRTARKGWREVILDGLGRLIGGERDDGTFVRRRAEFGQIHGLRFWAPPGWIDIKHGPKGEVLWGLRDDGSVFQAPTRTAGALKTRLMLSVLHGQSLSYGVQSRPAITIAGVPGLLMFPGGRRPFEASDQSTAYGPGPLVPWVESNGVDPAGGNALYGETPMSGMAVMFAQRLGLLNGAVLGTDMNILGVCTGQGGMDIDSLDADSTYWSRVTAAIANGLAQAGLRNVTICCPNLDWEQGERDIVLGTSKAAYKAKAVTLQGDFQAAIRSSFGLTDVVPMVMGQTMSRLSYGVPAEMISQAQVELARENPTTHILATSNYIFASSDTVHLEPASSKLSGAYKGLAKHEALVMGRPWRHLDIDTASIVRQGKVVSFRLTGGHGKIATDTGLVSAVAAFGFGVTTSGGTALSVSTFLGPSNLITLVCDQAVGANATLTYARQSNATGSGRLTGPRGNIRDSSRELYGVFDPAGVAWPMDKWLVSFSEVVP